MPCPATQELIVGFRYAAVIGFWLFARRNPRRYGPAAAGKRAAH